MTQTHLNAREGYVPVPGGKVWYRIVGSGGATPLLTLHGGPGAGHDYLDPLATLASDRPVVFFDQLGCGKSDQPDNRELWRIARFVEEVSAVRSALGLERIHLFGQSWGGWLAIEYMLSKPPGVVSLILASTSASTPQFVSEVENLRSALPAGMQESMRRCEATGDFGNPECEAAVMEFYKRHLCRLDPWPEPLMRTVENITDNPVYETMNGPAECTMIGNLKDWDRADRLGEINVPSLITVGRYDEITPSCAKALHRGIPRSEMHIFEHSAHMAHLEESEHYLQIMSDFLERVEKQ